MIKLAIGIPAYRGIIASRQALMWMQLGAACALRPAEVKLVMTAEVDVCGIDRARNILLENAKENEADWLLMVDSDTWASGFDLLRMVLTVPPSCAMVGAIVRCRGSLQHNAFLTNAASMTREPARINPTRDFRDFQEVDAVGGAMIALNLQRIHALDFRWAYQSDGRPISEDLHFCDRLRALGELILVDTRIRTHHADRSEILTYEPNGVP